MNTVFCFIKLKLKKTLLHLFLESSLEEDMDIFTATEVNKKVKEK